MPPRERSKLKSLRSRQPVPQYVFGQAETSERAQKVYPQFRSPRLDALYTNTGIDTRYAVKPQEWYLEPRTWEERTAVYQENALDLLERVTKQSVDEAGLSMRDIDVVVTNTITGLSIPSLEARLMNRLPIRPTVERLPNLGLPVRGRRRWSRAGYAHGTSAARYERPLSHHRPLHALRPGQ